ncbi:ABC transporter permease [Rhabdothermincola salaria]|uniref:ABC transporter permease n=1 Tax=Rhabdothermincola salaria TaxID=2903142 RepID=UPI001E390AA9|nr:FtsX-like permease family protein [Rhabdothermincola salaria]MCD9623554.1 FtsX-like permease family protein [Rhabdothermincola salaria]
MLRVTLRGLLAHKVRLATTALAILLGVAFMSGTLVLTATIGSTFDGLFADINAGTDVVVRSAEVVETDFGEQRGTIDESVLGEVAAVPGVRVAEGDVSGYAQFVDKEGEAIGNPNQGAPTLGFAWGDDPELNPLRLAEGGPPAGPDEVVMDKASADTGDFRVGDPVTVLTATGSQEFTVAGIARFGNVDSPLGASIAAFALPTAQELFGLEGRLVSVLAAAEEGIAQAELAERVAAALPAGLEAITGDDLTEEQQSTTRDQLGFFNTFLLTFALIALFVGAFIIYNTFSIIVAQRTREMALLRAIGAARRQVLSSVLIEAVVTALVASAVGVLAGLGVAIGLRNLFASLGIDIPADGLTVEPNAIVVPIVVGVVITLVSAVLPARRASRVPPIAALRDVAHDESGRSVLRAVAGVAVLALGGGAVALGLGADVDNAAAIVGLGAALTFMGVAVLGPVIAGPLTRVIGWPLPHLRGIAGHLARENAMRNPKRTSSTAAALMIGVGLVGFITIVAASASTSIRATVDDGFVSDFVVQSNAGFQGGLSPTVADDIRALPEVEAVAELRTGVAQVDGNGTFLTGLGAEEFARVADIGVEEGDIAALADEGTIAVYDQTADDKGWALGDTVSVVYPTTGEQQLRIVALFSQEEVLGEYATGLSTYDANNEVLLDAIVFVALADGVSLDDGRAAISTVTDAFPNADLQDKTEFADAIVGQLNQLLNLVYVLLLLAVVIALIGIANTLALSVFERTRELGLLRAVGMTRRQMRSSVRWESVIIAVLGTLMGLVIGAVFGWALVQALASQGFTSFTLPVGTLVVVVVIAALAGVVAAIPPARRAARLDILSAISTD